MSPPITKQFQVSGITISHTNNSTVFFAVQLSNSFSSPAHPVIVLSTPNATA
jgi:hypothetical protein